MSLEIIARALDAAAFDVLDPLDAASAHPAALERMKARRETAMAKAQEIVAAVEIAGGRVTFMPAGWYVVMLVGRALPCQLYWDSVFWRVGPGNLSRRWAPTEIVHIDGPVTAP